jgi:hypothetical protein
MLTEQNPYLFFVNKDLKIMTYEYTKDEQSFVCIKHGEDEMHMPTKTWRAMHQGWLDNGWDATLDDTSCVDACFEEEE